MDSLKMYFLLKMVIFQPAMLVYHRLNFRVCFPIRRTWLAHFGRGCRDSNGLPVVAMSSCFTRKKQMLIHLFSYFPGAKKSCQFRKISQKKNRLWFEKIPLHICTYWMEIYTVLPPPKKEKHLDTSLDLQHPILQPSPIWPNLMGFSGGK